MCALGQWKVKFDPKPMKGHFSKLNGDLVKVPILYHQNYVTVMTSAVELRAQVKKHQHTHPKVNHSHRLVGDSGL